MRSNNKWIWAILYIALGIIFIVMKNGVVSAAMTVAGIAAIIMAIVDFSNKNTAAGVVEAVVGVCVIVFGWMFVSLALYIFTGVLIVSAVFQLIQLWRMAMPASSGVQKMLMYLRPVASLLAGVCLLFNQEGSLTWIFTVAGIFLLVEGVLSLMDGK